MKKLTNFIHNLDLLPILIVVSVYHYYKALSMHDPMLVAAAFAVGLDLTHYTVVRRAAHTRAWSWIATSLPTTAIVFSLQYFFYAAPVADGATLSTFQAVVFASVVPLCITILAVVKEAAQLEYSESAIAELESSNRSLQGKLGAATRAMNDMKEKMGQAKAAVAKLQEAERKMQRLDAKLQEAESKLQERDRLAQENARLLQERESQLQESERLLQGLNPLTLDIARLTFDESLTQAAIAERHGVSEAVVSRLKTKVNGHVK